MNRYDIKINGRSYIVDIESVDAESASARVKVNGKELDLKLNSAEEDSSMPAPVGITSSGSAAPQRPESPARMEQAAASDGMSLVLSPLPGVIIGIHVSVGDIVQPGQRLATLEAMKMENAIEAERGGTVRKIYVNKGDSILEGAKIIAIG